ncbi:cell wall degradation protein [Citrobacter koseri]|uniref:Cell wall degradation protein n=1 Tax=Citrobacter koseri TaxID=545 RepID=A0A2X2WH12_CITKO|nr:cell wall degradation protein [Citrobacter koseri]
MSAGRLNNKSLSIVMLLCAGLLLAGCSSNQSSDSGSVYTVKRGDTLYRISRTTGTSVKELARLNGISPPYTIEVGQKLKLGGGAKAFWFIACDHGEILYENGGSQTVLFCAAIFLASGRATVAGAGLPAAKSFCLIQRRKAATKALIFPPRAVRRFMRQGPGKVVYVGNQLRGYGNLIMIKHNEDYITAYAHNDTLLVNNGQSVKAGQKIATMGSTDADSVRLHFQIRYRATAIDPLRYLPPQGSKPKC